MTPSAAAATPEPTLGRRIAFKSLGALLALPLNIVLQAIIPRALGAAAYGDYSFLSAYFTSVLSFADSGTSQAYFNKLSQRPAESALSAFYARYAAAIFVTLGIFIAAAFLSGAAPQLWPDLPLTLVALAALMAFGNWLISVFGKAVDANALTGFGELATLVTRLVLTICVIVLFVTRMLSVRTFFGLQNLFNFLLVAALITILSQRGRARAFFEPLDSTATRRYVSEFWDYCHPLLVVSLAVLVTGILDRWLLQRLAGSIQQGFLGLGLQVGSVVFIFGGATASLLGREFARSHYERDVERLRAQFVRHLPRAYSVTAFFGIFLAVQAPSIVQIFGGEQFTKAAPATALLCLYPLHQVYGQIGASLLYATDRTKAIRSISIAGLTFGLGLTIFFIAPAEHGGLELGALGIALKMLVHQVAVVNLVLWVNTRYLRIPLVPFLTSQIVIAGSFGGCALLASAYVSTLGIVPIAGFLLSGTCYTTMVLALAWLLPSAIGFDREDIAAVARRLHRSS